MPKHTRGDIDIMVGHTFVIRLFDTIHVYQRIAHFILSTVNEGIDNTLNALIAHYMDVHGDSLFVSLACDVRQFLFRPVGNALMSVRIERIYKSCAAFHRAVHEHFEPVRPDMRRFVFLCVSSLLQRLVHIHPAVHFPCRA